MGLNERVLALRNLKSRIIKSVEEDTQRISAINKELGRPDEAVFVAKEDPSEWPENRYTHTPEDLVAFEKQLEQERKAALAAQKASAYGGGGGDDEEDEKR